MHERIARQTFSGMEDSEDDWLVPQQVMEMRPQPLGDIGQLLKSAEREKENILKKIQLESEARELRTRLMHKRWAMENARGTLHFAPERQKTLQLAKQALPDELALAGTEDPDFDTEKRHAQILNGSRFRILRARDELKILLWESLIFVADDNYRCQVAKGDCNYRLSFEEWLESSRCCLLLAA